VSLTASAEGGAAFAYFILVSTVSGKVACWGSESPCERTASTEGAGMLGAASKAVASSGAGALLFILIIVGIGAYFIPTIVAFSRKHPNAVAIFATNLLAGWTFIGWIVSLVWSLTNPQRSQTVVVTSGAPPQSPSSPPPGWYADAATPGSERWWDGQRWSEHVKLSGEIGAPPPVTT
jgi:hypothetical protein